MTSPEPLLRVRDLRVTFATEGGLLRAVDGVSFDVPAGRTVGLVGESGAGKSVTAHAILRLLPTPPARIEAGQIFFHERELGRLDEREMRALRGGAIAMVFQEPMTSLNPVYTVGEQLVEAIRLHHELSRRAARARALELLGRVSIDRPDQRIDAYPHELSGGMRQRVLIAMALAGSPELLIADEPTSALDMVTQAELLALLAELRETTGMSLLLVAHDLHLVASLCDDVVVLYAGEVVEHGPPAQVLAEPRHPYTRALLACVPSALAEPRKRGRSARLLPLIEGEAPDVIGPRQGCAFAPRCPDVEPLCRIEEPLLLPLGPLGARTLARCHVAQRRDAAEAAP
jgi:peptide/nickel transport system ATP-binding protein